MIEYSQRVKERVKNMTTISKSGENIFWEEGDLIVCGKKMDIIDGYLCLCDDEGIIIAMI